MAQPSRGVVSAVVVSAIVAASLSARADFIYDTFVAECRKAGGTPRSTLDQYARGEPFVCDQGGSGQSRSAASPGGCETEAKINLDWIFADSGARERFSQLRSKGKSPLDAAIGAQGHNPNAQKVLRECASWAIGYLRNLGERGGGAALPPPPTQEACRCISVVPTGDADNQGRAGYRVTNGCGPLNVKVRFTGDILSLSARDAFSAWANAGEIGNGSSAVVRPPAWKLVSIKAVSVTNAGGSFTCNF